MADQTRIDWCDATVNPWGWGCYGPGGTADKPQVCWYCYARRLAQRKLRACPDCQAFRPHWHPQELEKPLHWKRPRRIFVQSMGDPFGEWVTREQLVQVFAHIGAAPQHTYMFLTKQPQNILRLLPTLPVANVWVGASVDTRERGFDSAGAMWSVRHAGWQVFASVEPVLAAVAPESLGWAEWVIIGALTGPVAKTYRPRREWVTDIIERCDEIGTPVFVKSSLAHVSARQEWPEVMPCP